MKRLQTYIGLAILSCTMFSCTSNKEWTPEYEKEFIDAFKSEVLKDGDLSEEQANFTANCIIEKLKEKKLSPADAEKTENESLFIEIVTKCTQDSQKQ